MDLEANSHGILTIVLREILLDGLLQSNVIFEKHFTNTLTTIKEPLCQKCKSSKRLKLSDSRGNPTVGKWIRFIISGILAVRRFLPSIDRRT